MKGYSMHWIKKPGRLLLCVRYDRSSSSFWCPSHLSNHVTSNVYTGRMVGMPRHGSRRAWDSQRCHCLTISSSHRFHSWPSELEFESIKVFLSTPHMLGIKHAIICRCLGTYFSQIIWSWVSPKLVWPFWTKHLFRHIKARAKRRPYPYSYVEFHVQ